MIDVSHFDLLVVYAVIGITHAALIAFLVWIAVDTRRENRLFWTRIYGALTRIWQEQRGGG